VKNGKRKMEKNSVLCNMKNFITSTLFIWAVIMICPILSFSQNIPIPAAEKVKMHHEFPDDSYLPPPTDRKKTLAPRLKNTGIFTTQVNVDANGYNIVGDAANEPSIAVDPINPDRMVIGWRQFDNVGSNFRQAGYGYSTDAGQTWTFPGVIQPGIFRSDPVLDSDSAGNFYYNSLTTNFSTYVCKVFKSSDGGASWNNGTNAHGGDKQWMTIDRTGGQGTGNIYSYWTSYYSSCMPGFFTRSTDDGNSFEECVEVDGNPYWGTMAVGPDGELYIAGSGASDGIVVSKSTEAQISGNPVFWDFSTYVDMDGFITGQAPVNPVGILGQAYIDVDRSNGTGRGNIYVLASMPRISTSDPADVMFAKSTDGGLTWSAPQRINTDASTAHYQWFGTMSVAPNGRIDVIWLDTREAPVGTYLSALYYCYSVDQGETWSPNEKLSDEFDPSIGYPQQDKMGDYFDMKSDNIGAHLAWANTLNGEEDVYYSHIVPDITGMKENPGTQDILSLTSSPNPFRDLSVIKYKISNPGHVKLDICNVYGEVISTLVDKNQTAGTYTVNMTNNLFPAGFYFCRLSAGENTKTIRLIKIN